MEVDFLLIGQGLAGTVLSYRLIKGGQSVYVMDKAAGNNSSRVAAGLFNPVTGRKMVKTWNADKLFPEIVPLYRELEQATGANFLYLCPLYRPFISVEEQNEWMGKSSDEGYQDYIQEIRTTSRFPEVNDPYGGVLLRRSGYIDLNTLLDAYAEWLKTKGCLSQEGFEEEGLQFRNGKFYYNDIVARQVVYCNGLGAMQSRYFEQLPFAPVKGEILELKQSFQPREIINRGVFRITMPDGVIRVGSTYSWHDLKEGPTEKAKEEILERLDKLVPGGEREVLSHRCGVRPATKDRKPFLGKHHGSQSVYIFNGFGAKGVSLVPYYSRMMFDLLVHGDEPEKDVNISRFF